MDQILKAAFIFVAPEADPMTNRAWVKTPKVHVLAIGVRNYDQAEAVARELVEKEGIGAIELCGGFGNAGTARIAAAVKVPVGAVRFDIHPGLGNASGDTIF
jgi:hypothetical protein